MLDEPNSNLDDVGEAALVATVKDLKERGATVVLITHRMSVLNAVDKLLVLRDGALTMYGARDEVLKALRQQQLQAQAKAKAQVAGTSPLQIVSKGQS